MLAAILERLDHQHDEDVALLRQIAARPTADRLSVGLGRWKVSAGGMGVIVFLGIAALTASILFGASQVQTALREEGLLRQTEHTELSVSQARMACILTMTVEERMKFRDTFSIDSWGRWCPWVREMPPRRGG